MKKRLIHVIAGLMILCMVGADASMYIEYASIKGSDGSADEYVVTEEHEMDVALADGYYSGNDSDSEHAEEDIIESNDGKHLFNILEILPTERKAVVGFTIGGCEPVTDDEGKPIVGLKYTGTDDYIATTAQMREAYMDALVNPNPGSNNGNDQNILNNETIAKLVKEINEKLSESGVTAPFTLQAESWWPERNEGIYNGYYKYVGHNKGFYALESKGSNNAVMRSKFYYNVDNYDYIFVYSEAPSGDGRDINVKNHKRIKYINNEKFIKDYLEIPADKVTQWKEDHVTEVVTRTPETVSVDDIERADVIFLNGGQDMDYYRFALELYNRLHGDATDTDSNKKYSNGIDFDEFEKVIKIYERIAVKQDAAIIVSKECSASTVNGVDTNIHKLICMLFYATKESDSRPGAGRDVFMNFLKRYVDEPGPEYLRLRDEFEAHKKSDGTADPHYPDFRAPSIRHDDYYNGVLFHHYYWFNPGHPLVLNKDEAIVGAHYDENTGKLVPEYGKDYPDKVKDRRLERSSPDMYIDAKISDDENVTPHYSYDENNSPRNWVVDAYQSMSNTTDYIYIDEETGAMVRDDKYSGYWYNMDADDVGNGNAFKKITWRRDEFSVWPWGYEKVNARSDSGYNYNTYPANIWFYNIDTTGMDDGFRGDLHLWFDYYEWPYMWWGKVRMIKEISGSTSYENQTIAQENDIFKSTWIKQAVSKRKFKREENDETHTADRIKKDYYISMNILNGDGVNAKAAPGSNNKTIYYNQYELDDIRSAENPEASKDAVIPIKIRLKSSCELRSVKVMNATGTVLAEYQLNFDPNGVDTKTVTGSKGRTLELDRPPDSLNEDGTTKETTSSDHTPIHTFEGEIYDITHSYYEDKRNFKVIVELEALAPGDNIKRITDEVTIVRRDFFMLD